MSTPAKPQNGNRPSCSACTMRGELCFYERSNRRNLRRDRAFGHANGSEARNVVPEIPQVWNSWPMDEVDALLGLESNEIVPSLAAEPHLDDSYQWLMPNNELPGVEVDNSAPGDQNPTIPQVSGSATPPVPRTELPELPELLQLIDLFFEKFYRYFPILHKQTILSAINSQGTDGVPPVLLFAIIAVSAGSHPDLQIRRSQPFWYERAKIRLSKEMQLPHNVLQTLQAAVLVIYLGLAFVDYSSSIIFLSEAWRKTVAISHSYGDSLRSLIVQTLGTQEKATWIEREEITRISWMLFIMDRGMCFPIGLIHAVDDRRMKIEFPMKEYDFQEGDGPASTDSGRFTHNLDKLITMMRDRILQGSATQLQYLILGYVLLGRISEALDYQEEDDKGWKELIESLCEHLSRIRLMLPRSATELSLANYDEFAQVIWLNVILNACTILLHHRPLHEGESLDDTGTELATHWPHCVAAARGTISILRDAARVSIDFVTNAHFPCLLFTSCRVLMTEYFCPSRYQKEAKEGDGVHMSMARDPKLREDLEVVAMTFSRMREEWRGIGQKFSKGMYYYLQQGEDFARKSKAAGARSVLGVCDTWANIPDAYELTIPS
ncbi:mfs transporter [Trichoderma arundinaceum]|uniref:Mfs transporter n=1 Tax=Trichoderma arundinaceum TaxID=490622 RepID=A0A395P0E0_TRIAR|nr:mfs transporter [Trichoderma arundinaceum]